MRVSVHVLSHNTGAGLTCKAMAKGIARCGDKVDLRTDRDFNVEGYDAIVIWGYVTSCQTVIDNAKRRKIPWVFMDMGYWRRELGYYKVAVNDRHPTHYLTKVNLPDDRWRRLGLEIKPWKINVDGPILVAGMSGKASWSWGLRDEQYETQTIRELTALCPGRKIIYRPKPNWHAAKPINGAKFDRHSSLSNTLPSLYCVVSHHSNVCCDALIEGIPVFCKYGAASVLGPHNLEQLPKLHMPEGREQWAANLAYAQWNLHEMASGACWDHLKNVRFYNA